MLTGKTKIIFIFLLFLANFLLRTKTTSADIFAERLVRNNVLSASTLSFSERHTANNNEISYLFNTSGIRPFGFDVKAVRLKKEGKLDFKYHLKAMKTGGDDGACQNLSLQVLLKGQEKYKGPLLQLSFDSNLKDHEKDDLVLFIGLDENNSAITNKLCEFDFVINTYRNSPDESPVGFFAKKHLTNSISLGAW
ncbi:MAG: hypothetical protein AAB929_05920 [Patescibacteria group bacterium]